MGLPQNLIKEALDERVGSSKLFTEAGPRYLKVGNEINNIRTALLNNRLPQKTPEELAALRTELISKFSVFKSYIKHSQLFFSCLIGEIEETKRFISDENILKEREEIKKNIIMAKKKLDELNKKKIELQEVNRMIDDFKNYGTFTYTEEELSEVFGSANIEKIKRAKGVQKSVIKEKIKKSTIVKDAEGDVEINDATDETKQEDGEEKKDDNGVEGDAEEEEFEEVEVVTYTFKGNLSKSVSQLKEIQEKLIADLEQYELDIAEIKKIYMDNLSKFEAIKRIVGLATDEDEAVIDKKDEDGDSALVEDDKNDSASESEPEDSAHDNGDELDEEQSPEQEQDQEQEQDPDDIDEEALYKE